MRLPRRGRRFFWIIAALHFDDWQGVRRLASCGD